MFRGKNCTIINFNYNYITGANGFFNDLIICKKSENILKNFKKIPICEFKFEINSDFQLKLYLDTLGTNKFMRKDKAIGRIKNFELKNCYININDLEFFKPYK